MKYADGEPCPHPGCLAHISHPCEGCGRIGGLNNVATTCPVIDDEGTVEHVFVATERTCRCGKYLRRDLFRF